MPRATMVEGGNAFTRTWYRVRETKTVAGVCAGLAEQFSVSVTLVRLAFLLSALFGGGMGIVIYLVLWVVMPYRSSETEWTAIPPPSG